MLTLLLVVGTIFGALNLIGAMVGTIDMTYGMFWLFVLGTSLCFWSLL